MKDFTPKFVNLEQGTQEWLDFRKMKIGSSSAASIMGVGFKTPLQLFEDMLEDRQTPQNEAMRRGTEMEPLARAWLNRKYNCELLPSVLQHPVDSYDWHISSVDGICKHQDSYFVCEIKHPGRIDHEMALDGVVPEKYIPQCYHILEDLPGVDKILYLSFHENSQAEIWVERDKQKMESQFEKEKEFYNRLISFVPPEPTEKDWIEFCDPILEEKAHRYEQVKQWIAKAQEDLETIKQDLLQVTGACPRAKIGDMKIQKIIRRGNVDYSKIEALKGLDLDSYRKDPTVLWKIS